MELVKIPEKQTELLPQDLNKTQRPPSDLPRRGLDTEEAATEDRNDLPHVPRTVTS